MRSRKAKQSAFLSAGVKADGVTCAMWLASLPSQTFSLKAIMAQSDTPKSSVVDEVGSIFPPYWS